MMVKEGKDTSPTDKLHSESSLRRELVLLNTQNVNDSLFLHDEPLIDGCIK